MFRLLNHPGIVNRTGLPAALLVLSVVGSGCNQQQQGAVVPGTNVPAPQPVVLPGTKTVSQPVVVTPPPVDAAQNAANKAQYEQTLAQASFEKAHADLQKKFGQNRMAVVVVNGVPGPVDEADHYLERKLFKAAWTDYEAGQQRARQETEANKKAAEEKAMAEHEQTWGNGFGPMTVWYRYKPGRSDVPYPEVRGGVATAGQHVYYVGPVVDLAAFAGRIKVGQISATDSGARTITIQSFIPVPIPDIDEEELLVQHGREGVLTVEIDGADGEPDRVTYYLENQIREMEGGTGLTLVGPRLKAPGRYRLVVGPIKDVNEFAARIGFGSIADLDPSARVLKLAAKLPADLPPRPTAAELAELRRQERMGDEVPKPGESEIDWAIRVLKKGDNVSAARKVLKALYTLKVEPDRLEDVGEALVQFGTSSTWAWHTSDDLVRAIEAWPTERTTRFLVRQLGEFSWDKKEILAALAKSPTEEAARAVAMLMTDRQLALDASATLRDMGPVAEDTVLKLAQDRFPSMRIEAYDILKSIGTSKSLSKLKAQLSKEKDKDAREALKSAIEDLDERLNGAAAGGTSNPFKKK
uniref:HEAT repeat domain-containing protein n=1 Tax=Schlesneria paludicola TaxID=360056 RepID=A0A7C2K0Z6_9PLAN